MTEIRVGVPADFGEVARLTVAAYAESGQLAEESGYAAALADVASRAEQGILLVAEGDGRLLGAVTLVLPGSRYAELCRPGEAEFRMLAVDPSAQGRGVGRLLVRECVRRARQQGCSALVICYRDFAAAAERLYLSEGFTRVPALDVVPVPGVNLLAMRLELPAMTAAGPGPGRAGRLG